MDEQFLHRSNIGTIFQQMSCKTVTKRMGNGIFDDPHSVNSLLEEIAEKVLAHTTKGSVANQLITRGIEDVKKKLN